MTGRGTRSVALAYGSGSLNIDVPADATVVLPRHQAFTRPIRSARS